jgi:hypothetical protein
MPPAAPTTAERIRSACARAGGAMLAVEGVEPTSTPVHHLLDDGSFAITVPSGGVLAEMMHAADPDPALLQVHSDSGTDTRYVLVRLEIDSDCNFESRATTATTMSGCHSQNRWTT